MNGNFQGGASATDLCRPPICADCDRLRCADSGVPPHRQLRPWRVLDGSEDSAFYACAACGMRWLRPTSIHYRCSWIRMPS